MVCKLFLIQTGTATSWHSARLFSSVVTFMVMSPFSETCSTQCLGLLVTPLEPFVVVSPSTFLLPFFIHWLFHPHLKFERAYVCKMQCQHLPAMSWEANTVDIQIHIWSDYWQALCAHNGVSATHAHNHFNPTRPRDSKRDTEVGLGSTEASVKTFGCEMLDLIIPDTTSCRRNQSKGQLIIQAFAFVKTAEN